MLHDVGQEYSWPTHVKCVGQEYLANHVKCVGQEYLANLSV